jgi:hypothetical protein
MFTKYASAFMYFPGGFGTQDELFEILTLVQTTKVEAYPIVFFGTKYWAGLIDWFKSTLAPTFIDDEDLDIFKLVDDPHEAVELVKKGVKKHWWKPSNEDVANVAQSKARRNGKKPLEAGKDASDTGEGTNYGTRPRRPDRKHARPAIKPEQ